MKYNKILIIIIVTISFMTIGYAALNTTLDLGGRVTLKMNDNFSVFFSNLKIDGIEYPNLINNGGTSFTFSTTNINTNNQSSIDYQITNKSKQYDASVSVTCDPIETDYFSINDETKTIKIEAMKTNNGLLTTTPKESSTLSRTTGTLLYDIVKNQSKGLDTSKGINYNDISSASNGEGVYETTNTDSGNSVYFYRGAVTNNNIIYANSCWQILRTTETGGTKLFYNGHAVNGRCPKPTGAGLKLTKYTVNTDDNAYVGYMYGTPRASTYAAAHENKNDSLIKQEIDKWYESNILGTTFENYLEDAVWCSDRTIVSNFSNFSSSGYGTLGYGQNATAYGFAIRGGHYAKVTTPTLKCGQANDRFTQSTANGNGALKYPIATITGDELIYAGATGGKPTSDGTSPTNTTFFLNHGEGGRVWTMTPHIFQTSKVARGTTLYEGAISSLWTNIGGASGRTDFGIRPAVSIKGNAKVTYGEGTNDKPYILETEQLATVTCSINVKAIERTEIANTDYKSENLYENTKLLSLGTDTENSIDYNSISSTSNGEGVYETINTDSGIPVYFYRGNTKNNNVLFANHCWQIVRTTETGGTKLIYNGNPSSQGTCNNSGSNSAIGKSVWNNTYNDNSYVGYMYGTSNASSYENTHQNINDSTIKQMVDTWYEDNLKGTDYENMLEDTPYCNDRSMVNDFSNFKYQDWLNYSDFSTKGYGTNSTMYSGSAREGVAVEFTRPTLKCSQKTDRLTKSAQLGTGSLKYPIGLLTADEAIYAGATGGIQGKTSSSINKDFYLYTGEKHFWTMTPHRYHNNNVVMLVLSSDGNIANEVSAIEGGIFVRPVISLNKNATILEGNGSKDSPYVLSKTTSSIPKEWQDNGIFSDYYEQAYAKLLTMSIEEKIGQLMIVRYYASTTESDAVKNYHVGGTTFYATDFNNKTTEQVKNMTAALQNSSKIPLITAVDEEGGSVIRVSSNPNLVAEPFKSPKELYDSGGLDLITKDTVNKSSILLNLGLNMNFAPVVDIANSTSYIYKRTVGYGAEITGQYAETVVNASKNTGVSYSLKHFPGYGNNADTHTSSSVDETSLEELWNKHLVPFIKGINNKAEAVMISHNIVSVLDKENPSSLSKPVHDLLLNDLKFTGIAITDDLDMAGAADVPNKYTKALLAGNNIMLISKYADAQQEILTNISNNTITEEYISKLAFKVIAWKYYKGLLS